MLKDYIILDDTYIFKDMIAMCNWVDKKYTYINWDDHFYYKVPLSDSEIWDYHYNDTYEIMFDIDEFDFLEDEGIWI